MHDPIAIAAAMERELSFLRNALFPPDVTKKKMVTGTIAGKTVYVLRTGIGPSKTDLRLGELGRVTSPQCIISIGCAGALDPSLQVGDIVAPSTFHDAGDGSTWKSAPALVEKVIDSCRKLGVPCRTGSTVTTAVVAAGPVQKRQLAETYGAIAVDMESSRVAGWAASAGIPMVSVRAISDLASDALPPELSGLYDRDGNLRAGQLLKSLIAKPSLLADAFQLKAKFDRSLSVLARIMLALLEEL